MGRLFYGWGFELTTHYLASITMVASEGDIIEFHHLENLSLTELTKMGTWGRVGHTQAWYASNGFSTTWESYRHLIAAKGLTFLMVPTKMLLFMANRSDEDQSYASYEEPELRLRCIEIIKASPK